MKLIDALRKEIISANVNTLIELWDDDTIDNISKEEAVTNYIQKATTRVLEGFSAKFDIDDVDIISKKRTGGI